MRMKVNWLFAATMSIAASLGLPLVSSAQSPTYTIADFQEPTGGPPMPPPDPKPMVQNGVPAAPMMQPMAPAAEAPAEEEEATCDPWRLFCQKECGWNIHGFVHGGWTGNPDGPASGFNGPVTFNDQNTALLNSLYIIGEKTIDRETCCWNWGGRIDVLYGSDYVFTQSNGWETTIAGAPKWNGNAYYGLAIPQLYAEVGNEQNSIKLGHFYTVLGYEVVPANGNFFYSHAYTMQYGEPFTHWGLLGSYKWSDEIALNYGLVNGWDALNRVQDDPGFILGLTWTGCRDVLAFNAIFGNEPNIAGGYSDRYTHSLVYTYNINDCWQYVFQHDLGFQNGTGVVGGPAGGGAEWYGINQYLFYKINDCWKAGVRAEWFRDDDGARVTGLRPAVGAPLLGQGFAGNFYEISAGLNWTPSSNLTVRAEYRYDKFSGVSTTTPGLEPYGDGTRTDQSLVALDFIFLY
jgi:opacity protein-like surface antigen